MKQLILMVMLGSLVFVGCEGESEYQYTCQDEDWFQAWDADDNQFIEEDEFIESMMNVGYFFYWDGNASSTIEPLELDLHHLQTYGNFREFDQNDDGVLEEVETLQSLFTMWDRDLSGYLECSELDTEYLKSFSDEFEPQER